MKSVTGYKINITVSYHNIYIALAISLAVIAVLYHLKTKSASAAASATEGFSINFAALARAIGQDCKPAAANPNQSDTRTVRTIRDFDKFKSKDQKIKIPPCVYIQGKAARLAYIQEQLILNIQAENFMKIYNNNDDPYPSKNDSNRREFALYLANALYLSNTPEDKIGEFQASLSGKQSVSLAEAKRILTDYPVLKTVIDSFIRAISTVHQTVINNTVDGKAEFTPTNYQPDGTVSPVINRQRMVITPDFSALSEKTSALNTESCDASDNSCVYGAKIEADPAMAKWLDTIVSSYPANLAVDVLDTYNTAFKNKENVAAINTPLTPLTQAELNTYRTSNCTGSGLVKAFG